MPKNDDGEFELILGNRQLLSVFFVVVILLGVFFTMGYIVGRNSTPLGTDPVIAQKTEASAAETPSKTAEIPASDTARTDTARTGTARTDTGRTDTAPPVATEAQKPDQQPEPARPTVASAAKAAKSAGRAEPSAGQTYLQLAATSQHEADIMVDVLQKKGFKALAAVIEERPGTFRVLVGPIQEPNANKLRADLQASGFPGNSAIRRTF